MKEQLDKAQSKLGSIMNVHEMTEVKRHEPTATEGGVGKKTVENLPSCDITGLDITTGDTTYTSSSWCGEDCEKDKAVMDLSYNNVTFYGSVYLADSGANRSSFLASSDDSSAVTVSNMLFSTTWANTGIVSSSMKSTSGGSVLHPGETPTGYDGTPGKECYPSGLVSGATTVNYNINDEY